MSSYIFFRYVQAELSKFVAATDVWPVFERKSSSDQLYSGIFGKKELKETS
jgi:hypothetical protein